MRALRGKLFPQDFLLEGITLTPGWRILENDATEFRKKCETLFKKFPISRQPNEAVTESELVVPILELIGWKYYLPQQNVSGLGRSDVPDILIFNDDQAKSAALNEERDFDRYLHGRLVCESKRWQRPLDKGDRSDALDPGIPSNQILRYLSRVDVASNGAIRWGILTNGRIWRLYYQDARSRLEDYLEIDLLSAVVPGTTTDDMFDGTTVDRDHVVQVFLLLFGRAGFQPQTEPRAALTFHALALEEARQWEGRVAKDLGDLVFRELYPSLLQKIVECDEDANVQSHKYLDQVRHDGLILLYRLLFVLYAEDRDLLPVTDRRYDDYSLRRIREDIDRRIQQSDTFSEYASRYYRDLLDLFEAIDRGDESIGLPPYNGGLFDSDQAPILARIRLPDSEVAALLNGLSRREESGDRVWINYRDLSVQHLGSIYERLLEYMVVCDDSGSIQIRPNPFARRTSGSFYTHDDLVGEIIRRSIGPHIRVLRQAYESLVGELRDSRETVDEKINRLCEADPATNILRLRICDPAIGSGHFLVSVVDYLADEVMEAIDAAVANVDWLDGANYESPLAARLTSLRERILEESAAHGWTVKVDQLDDRHIVKRMILKRVIYGVDKNPMAVELAKLSLWLHTFTTGAPLSFLDHHFRVGDSLFGEEVEAVYSELEEFGAIFQKQSLERMRKATSKMAELYELTDADLAEAHRSQRLYSEMENELRPLRELLNFWHALRWIGPLSEIRRDPLKWRGLTELLLGNYGDLLDAVCQSEVLAKSSDEMPAAQAVWDLLQQCRAIASDENFLHWEVAFPGVWQWSEDGSINGGFDIIVGNPPWDRMKLQQVEWFASRKPAIAQQSRASDRKRMIQELCDSGDELWQEYKVASGRAAAANRVARSIGAYPLLATGDINIYSLFVERALALVKEDGVVGFVTPSGIAGDKTSAAFFKEMSSTGRLSTLLDFENRKVFFPDIHASFKFCIIVIGGPDRKFEACLCGMFLRSLDDTADPDRCFFLSAADFIAVNPNTGTAPVFRSRKDAKLTTSAYHRMPVLFDRTADPVASVWPVKYSNMFHMTNDSGLFKTGPELEQAGFYPVTGNCWRRGEVEYVPLYEGKMFQAYDFRAAGVVVNPENIHRPANPQGTTPAQKCDPDFLPSPQFWVPRDSLRYNMELDWVVAFKHVTAATNVRTMIACIAPAHGFGNSAPIFLPADYSSREEYSRVAPCLLANLNSIALDYVLRQKVQGQNLNLYILEQLPVVSPAMLEKEVDGKSVEEHIREAVLSLTCNSSMLQEFAIDLGAKGPPLAWDEEERLHQLCRLDAIFFDLYGFDLEAAEYIFSQFPILAENDQSRHGRFISRDLTLAYLRAVRAGDLSSRMDIR